MSFRELTMIDAKKVLRRWAAGQSERQIARDGVVTGARQAGYIEAAISLGLGPSDELTDERVRGVAQMRAGAAAAGCIRSAAAT